MVTVKKEGVDIQVRPSAPTKKQNLLFSQQVFCFKWYRSISMPSGPRNLHPAGDEMNPFCALKRLLFVTKSDHFCQNFKWQITPYFRKNHLIFWVQIQRPSR
jgi:hypothetical protein